MLLLHLYISVVGVFLANLVELDGVVFSLAVDTAIYVDKHIVGHFFDLKGPKNGNFLKTFEFNIFYDYITLLYLHYDSMLCESKHTLKR